MKTLIVLLFSLNTYAMDFQELWKQTQQNSDQISATKKLVELKKLEKERTSRHWIPRVMLGARQFNTNDPSAVLFNRLGQGEVQSADFAESEINDPGNQAFTTGNLMIDLPLYEGGMKSGMNEVNEKMYESSQYEAKAIEISSFTETLERYSTIAINEKHKKEVQKLKGEIQKLVQKYNLGSKSNPVGYSGLLGFKGLIKKSESLLNGLEAENEVKMDLLKVEAGLQSLEIKKIDNLKTFLNQTLKRNNAQAVSSQLKAMSLKVQALDGAQQIEQARFLPKLGAFANTGQYRGERGENTVQSVGVYLQWDLFNNDSYGRKTEAKVKAQRMKKQYDYYKKKESSYRKSLGFTLKQLSKNLTLIQESKKIINEQVEVSSKLYRKGRMNGIQMTQILDNKMNLIIQQKQMQERYIQTALKQYEINH